MNLTVLSNDENDIRFLYVNLAATESIDLYRIFDWQRIVFIHTESESGSVVCELKNDCFDWDGVMQRVCEVFLECKTFDEHVYEKLI